MAKRTLSSRARIEAALQHDEPDRVPFDWAATGRTGLRVEMQDDLLHRLEVDDRTEDLVNPQERIARPHEAVLERYPSDVEGVLVRMGPLVPEDDEGDERYEWRPAATVREEAGRPPIAVEQITDEWGVRWERREDRPIFRAVTFPLAGEQPDDVLDTYELPDPTDARRWEPYEPPEDVATLVGGFGPGLLEAALRLRGRPDVLRDLATGGGWTVRLIDEVLDAKIAYWEERLADPAIEANPPTLLLERERFDLLDGLSMDVKTFRGWLRSRWERLVSLLNRRSPSSAVFLFCDVYDVALLAELVEIGVRVVNLLPSSVCDAKPAFLKREFGESVTFWGGGTWATDDFLRGDEEAAADQVKATLDIFAPGGGFVWAPYPVLDAEIGSANVIRALDTLFEYGLY